MTNILKLGASALRAVPTPKPGVSADDYAQGLHDWHRPTGYLKIYGAAGNLAIIAAQLVEAQDEESRKLLEHLESSVPNEKLPTDKMAKALAALGVPESAVVHFRRYGHVVRAVILGKLLEHSSS
jgi:hypothetical protein